MGTARHLTLAVFYAGNPAQVGLGASFKAALRLLGASSGNVSQCRMFDFQGAIDAVRGTRVREKTDREYCSARLSLHPPRLFSTARAILLVLGTMYWHLDDTILPLVRHPQSGLGQSGSDGLVRVR